MAHKIHSGIPYYHHTDIILQYLGDSVILTRFDLAELEFQQGGGCLRRLHPGIIAQINSIVNIHLSINWCFFLESFDFRFLSSPLNSGIVISQ